MAKAVGDGKPGAAVALRYEFGGKPSAGAPTELELAFIPNAGVDSLEATLTGMEGITLAGPLTASFNDVESGKPYRHTVSVLPDHTGVFYITVTVNTQIAGSSLARTFAVPFVVGQAPQQQKPEPARDAKGEAIEPMPAQETTSKSK
jgi:transglutaminase-like putative cysteine protease